MKKYSLLITALLFSLLGFGQESNEPQINTTLPTIIPPSPSVAALMKFEEIPVSNYTGIPDISIPLFNSPTLSKDITMAISLNYHPSSVAAEERSSDIGLGWSLFAGGTVSRTVKGMPDEIFQTGDILPGGYRFGIYQNSSTNIDYRNTYYDAIEDIRLYYDVTPDSVTEPGLDRIDRCLWNAQARGTMDAEHDLWQFNFMGKSGRFYIKKNSSNQLEVFPLDDYRVKITNTYGNSSNPYIPTSFTIYDEKGYKYIFDIVETTRVYGFVNEVSSTEIGDNPNGSADYIYNSSFHLNEIWDNNGKKILDFDYNGAMPEEVMDSTITYYREDSVGQSIRAFYTQNNTANGLRGFNPYPRSSSNGNTRVTNTRKVQLVKIENIAKVHFDYDQGREDENILNRNDCYVFKGITIQNWAEDNIKKVELTQDYSTTQISRMILKKVSFKNFIDNKVEDYELFYRANGNLYGDSSLIGKDNWGYFNLRPPTWIGGTYREVDPVFCTTETLQKMTLPTGGCILYHFEPNTYSAVGNNMLTDFSDNPANWNYQVAGIVYDNTDVPTDNNILALSGSKRDFFEIAEDQDVTFTYDFTNNSGTNTYHMQIHRLNTNSTYTKVGGRYLEPGEDDYDSGHFTLYDLSPGSYKIVIFTENQGSNDFVHANVYAHYHTLNSNNYQFLYGGGNRISKIGFFSDGSTDQTFYEQSPGTIIPEKEKKYNYNTFLQSLKSSGSLTYAVPKFNYRRYHNESCYVMVGISGVIKKELYRYYDVSTTFNNLNPIKTQGADIGYKNVKVYEQDNGWTEYEYTSPIDHPEPIGELNTSYPFLPTENYDYKRGLLKNETTYDQLGNKLKIVDFHYDFENYLIITGFRAYYPVYDFNNIYNHKYYNHYKGYIDGCGQSLTYTGNCNADNYILTDDTGSCNCFAFSGAPREFMDARVIKQAYGWAKLTSKTTMNYFYPNGGSIADIVQTDDTYTYNPVNKQISEKTSTNSKGEILKSKFYYHTGNSIHSQNRISEIERIENYRDSDLISTNKIVYSNAFSGNASYLPQYIQTSKGSASLENKFSFNAYDEYGNVLELQQENGVPTSYIWGYNKSKPIAKFENASNSQIATALGISVAAADESNLSLIDGLRSSLPYAMITTLTHTPLKGISSIKDAKGDVIYYEYDNFGRLNLVKDKWGNKLSENEYNYKN